MMPQAITDSRTHIFPSYLEERHDEYSKHDGCLSVSYSQPNMEGAVDQIPPPYAQRSAPPRSGAREARSQMKQPVIDCLSGTRLASPAKVSPY